MNNRFPSLPRKMKTDQCIMPICLAAFAGLFYLSLWMAGKMHIFDRRGYSIKGVILIIPIMGKRLSVSQKVQLHNGPPPYHLSSLTYFFLAFLAINRCTSHCHLARPGLSSQWRRRDLGLHHWHYFRHICVFPVLPVPHQEHLACATSSSGL